MKQVVLSGLSWSETRANEELVYCQSSRDFVLFRSAILVERSFSALFRSIKNARQWDLLRLFAIFVNGVEVDGGFGIECPEFG